MPFFGEWKMFSVGTILQYKRNESLQDQMLLENHKLWAGMIDCFLYQLLFYDHFIPFIVSTNDQSISVPLNLECSMLQENTAERNGQSHYNHLLQLQQLLHNCCRKERQRDMQNQYVNQFIVVFFWKNIQSNQCLFFVCKQSSKSLESTRSTQKAMTENINHLE